MSWLAKLWHGVVEEVNIDSLTFISPPSAKAQRKRERKVEACKQAMGDKYMNVPMHKDEVVTTVTKPEKIRLVK